MEAGGKKYDVIIVGAGPAGIFAALELTRHHGFSVAIVEKGESIKRRVCPSSARSAICTRCSPCAVVSGWGGAGAFSDGKLTLSTEVGGRLGEFISHEEMEQLIDYVDRIYLDFGAPSQVHGTDEQKIQEIERRAAMADLRFIPSRIRHMGTGRTEMILGGMQDTLAKKADIMTRTEVSRLLVEDGRVRGVELSDGRVLEGKYVIVAPGRQGAEWLAFEGERLGLEQFVNPVDIGVRVEIPAVVMEELTKEVYETKLVYYSRTFEDRVRTFCMCPHGEVVTENNDGIVTVNGHTHADRKTENTNFALLVSKTFTQPFREPITYGKYVAGLANLLGEGVIVQRLGDLMSGRRSTPERFAKGLVRPTLADATPGDLSLVFPYRHLVALLEMLQALDRLTPGVYSRNTLLYGVEVKFYSSRLALASNLETQIRNLFAAGDGAGVTRGLVQASAAGIVAAREILHREGVSLA